MPVLRKIQSAFIICSASESRRLQKVKEQVLTNYPIKLSFWDKEIPHVYDKRWMEQVDAVIVLLPNNGWSNEVDKLPTLMAGEIKRAHELKKKIYIGYKRKYDDQHNFYSITSDSDNTWISAEEKVNLDHTLIISNLSELNQDVIPVQPMSAPTGFVVHLNRKYNNAVGDRRLLLIS